MPATAVQKTIESGQCVSGSICFELIKGAPAAAVALLAALIAGLIAYRQYRVAKAKLNLDLFERRHKVFEIAWSTLSSFATSPQMNPQSITALNNIIPQASFLFGRDIEDYIGLILDNASELAIITIKGVNNGNTLLPEDIDNHLRLCDWFQHEAKLGAREKFSKYLNFENWH